MTTVVITGSTKGIGKGLAREFVRRGASVCIAGRSSAEVDAAVTELASEATGDAKVIGAVCDVAKIAEVQSLWDKAAAAFGRVDIWINNAGFARTGVKLLQLTPAETRAMIETNVIGTINGSQVAVRGLQAQGGGHLYNTLGGGHDGRVLPGMIGYGTTKRAIRYFTDSLVMELKGSPVKVGMISPGVNISDGMLREVRALSPADRKRMMWPVNVMGDYVETTTPWIVERVLADTEHGTHIRWMTGAKLLGRFFVAMFKKRDLFSRYGIATQ